MADDTNEYAKGSTVDVIKNRSKSIDSQVDAATAAPKQSAPAPQPTGKPISYDNASGRESATVERKGMFSTLMRAFKSD